MAGSFLPPVLFTIQANATQALASFNKVNAELKVMEAQAVKTGVALGRTTKAVTMATGATKILAIATAAFAAYGIKEIMSLEESYAKLGQTLAGRGLSTEENRKKAADLAQSYEKLGFDASNAADAFANLIAANGNMKTSTELMAKAADLARFKHMGLAEAAQLLIRAQNGNARIFKQFGIVMDENLPKAKATEKAMAQLNERIGGQAVAYTKTFRGQLEVLGKQIENFAEAIGAILLPVLSKLVSAFSAAGTFLKKYQAIAIGLAAVLTGVLAVGIANITKKLYQMAAAWAVANWEAIAIISVIVAVAASIVYLWNKFEGFRKGMVAIFKGLTYGFAGLIELIGVLSEVLTLPARGLANLIILKGKLFHDKQAVKDGKEILDSIDSWHASLLKADKAVVKFGEGLSGLKDSKIDLSKFSLKGLDIPKFMNGLTGADQVAGDLQGISDAAVNAAQKIKDFNQEIADSMVGLKESFATITTKDFEAAITNGLMNPVDQLITKAQSAVDLYQSASNKYGEAMATLKSAQKDYQRSIDSTDTALKASAESALKRAEEAVKSITDNMGKGLDDIKKYQDDMINSIVDSMNEISDLEKKKTEAQAKDKDDRLAAEKDYLKKMADLNKDYNKNVAAAQAEAAKRSADVVKNSVDQLRNIYSSATAKNIGEVYSNLTFGGLYKKGGNITALTANLKTNLGKAQVLADDAGKLSGMGFSQTFIEQVVSQGTEVGHQLAQQILASTPESIKELQDYWTQLDKQSQHGVDAIAKQMNSGLVLATEELTNQLAQVSMDLNTQLAQYAADLAEASGSAYQDYQDTLTAISTATSKIISEIDGQITALNSKIAQLRAALATLSTIGTPGTVQTPSTLAKTSIIPIPTSIADKSTVGGSEAQKAYDSMIAQGYDTTAALSSARYAGQAAQYAAQQAAAKTIVVNQNNYTNASADLIADSTAWAIRTAGDVSFAVNPKTNKMIPI